MEFEKFEKVFQKHVSEAISGQSHLFIASVDKDLMWETYQNSFPAGTNEIFRTRREYDCGHCRYWIKDMGAVVAIKDNQIVTMWDFEVGEQFTPVVSALAALVRAAAVQDVFVTKIAIHGTTSNKELIGDTVTTWNHFSVNLPKVLVTKSDKSEAALMGEMRDVKNVFKRSLDEISPEAVQTVLDLIAENLLDRGEEHRPALLKFQALQNEYNALPDALKDNFCWSKSVEVGGAVGKIRGHVIGTLLVDITNGVDVNDAAEKFEQKVRGDNYKRTKKAYTESQRKAAEKLFTEKGLIESLGRRHATIEDITVNNVLWANRNAVKRMGGVSVFEEMRQAAPVNVKAYENINGISIADFMRDIVPTATIIEALIENRHQPNLMSLVSPLVKGSPTLFKWNNAHSWAYSGNFADTMKERVVAAGGKVDGVFRSTLQFNDTEIYNPNDLDLHVTEPKGNEIYYSNKGRRHASSGMLDVDITHPMLKQVAIENTIYANTKTMMEGIYTVRVHCYAHRGSSGGFAAQIEFDGQVFDYEYRKDIPQSAFVTIARVEFTHKGGFKIIDSLPSTTSTRTVWALNTNQFHPVSVLMYSPNYWDGQGVGNRHYFFILPECKNDETPNGFYNEFLREEFTPHRHMLEALGGRMKVAPSDAQLSGVGFGSTKRDSLIVKVNDKSLFKIVF